MALNRAPFNALVDDDGSGSVGTPWNKQAIKDVLLDPIDAVITQPWVDVPFSAANFSAGAPMTWTVGAAAVLRNRYTVSGKVLFWSFYLSWFSGGNVLGGSPGATLYMTVPGGLTPAPQQNQLIVYQGGVVGIPIVAGLTVGVSSGPKIDIAKSVAGNFALSDVPGLLTTVILEVY